MKDRRGRRSLFSGMLIFVLFASVSPATAAQEDLLLQKRDPAAAENAYQKALDSHDFDALPARLGELVREIGDLQAAVGRQSAAVENYRKAADYYLKAENYGAAGDLHFTVGELFLRQEQQASALASYETALELYSKTDNPSGQGNALLRIGEVVVRQGDHARAFAAYSRALACYEKSGSALEKETVHSNLANLAILMGDAAMRGGKQLEALEYYNSGFAHAGPDTADTALLHRKKGAALIQLKEPERAAESLAAALAVYGKQGDLAACAAINKMLGDLRLKGGKYPEAADFFARAAALYRRSGDLQGRGNAMRGAGDAFFFSGQIARAQENYEAALDLFTGTNDVKGEAAIYRIFGEIHMQQGAAAMALKEYAKALDLLEMTGDTAAMKVIYRCQADALMRMGDKAGALALQAKAEALNPGADNILEKANKARVQADIYFRAGDNSMALEWYGEALALYRKSGDLSGEGNVIRAFGDVYVHAKNYPLALQQYEKALPILEKSGDQSGQGNIYLMQGSVAYMQGDNSLALKKYARAEALFDACRNKPGRITVMKSRADVYSVQRDFKQANPLYQSVLDFYTNAGDLEARAYTLFSMAQIAVRQGQRGKALQYYEDTLALLEKIRKQAGFSRLKKRFMEKIYDLYEEAVVFMIRNDLPAEALRNAEAMKARVFIDQLAEGQVVIKNGEPPEVSEKRELLEGRIAALDLRISGLASKNDDGTATDSLLKSRALAERELESLDVNLRMNNPLFSSVHYPEPVPVKELQQKILRPDETLLEYFVSSEGVYCFVVTGESLKAVKLPLARKELDQMVKDLLDAVAKGPSRISSQFEDKAAALYDRLLAPVEKMIVSNTVIIVPDGVLTKIPFEILCRKRWELSRFFLEMNTVKYFQSATLLALQRTKFRKEKFSSSFIGFGDPVYDYKPSGVGPADTTALQEEIALPRLEASGKEIREISEIFETGKRQAKVLLRGDANRKNAMSDEMKDYGFIHFAAHGIKHAGYQAIALSRTSSSKDNGMLTIGDIMSSSYEKSRVVVLSACQSGLGTFDRGEGVTGLTRAVMYSGSPAAVVSLWNVADSATMSLMESFYENVVSTEMKLDQALRSAKLAMIKSAQHRHPIFWGAFVMYGE